MNSNLSLKRLYRNAIDALLHQRVSYRFELIDYSVNLLPGQMVNLALNATHRFVPWAPHRTLPPVLQVEPASACSLRCPLCPTGAGDLGRAPVLLDFAVFCRLLEDVGPDALLLELWGWGEPFLNPRIYDMIRRAKEYDLVVVTSSNGQHFVDAAAPDRLVDSGLDTLIVGIDGTTEEAYRTYRRRGRLEKILAAAEGLLETRERRGLTHPLVNFQFTIMRQNERQIDEMHALAQRLQVDFLTLRTVAPLSDPEHIYPTFVPVNERFRRFAVEAQDADQAAGYEFNCVRPFSKAMVFADGTVGPCDVDHSASVRFGRLDGGNRFRDVWFSEAAREFRRRFVADKDVFPFCRKCPFKIRVHDDCVVAGFPYNPHTRDRLDHRVAVPSPGA